MNLLYLLTKSSPVQGVQARFELIRTAKKLQHTKLTKAEQELILVAWSFKISERMYGRELSLGDWITIFENKHKEVVTNVETNGSVQDMRKDDRGTAKDTSRKGTPTV